MIDASISNPDLIFNFFSNQTKLEKTRLLLDNLEFLPLDLGKTLLFHILKSSPELQELEFSLDGIGENGVHFTVSELGDSLKETSRLKSLTLCSLVYKNFSLHDSCPVELHSLPLTQYTRLKRLHLYNVDERISFEILNRCRTSSVSYTHLTLPTIYSV